MKSLRRAIQKLLERFGWGSAETKANESSAPEAGSSPDMVSSILDRTAADLRQLSMSEDENVDARPIIDRALRELSQLGFQPSPFEEQLMDRYLAELPPLDYQILALFKQGRKNCEIAEQLNTDVISVRTSLINTYAELRMRMIGSDDGGGGLPAESATDSKSVRKPMKRTLLSHS